jgi:hypothetical protein
MSVRGEISLAVFSAVFLCAVVLATAAEPNTGKNQSPPQAPASTIRGATLVGATVLDLHGQKLGRIKDVILDPKTGQATFVVLDAAAPSSSHPMTYSAARPIDNPTPPSPPPAAVQYVMPPPCMPSSGSGLPRALEDFYNE